MNNQFKYTATLLILAGAISCNVDFDNGPEVPDTPYKMPSWSNAYPFADNLNKLQCLESPVIIYNEDYSKSPPNITGVWKLLLDFSTGDTVDYSCKSVYYHFSTQDSMLYINSNADEIPNKQCKYSFAQYPFFDGIGCPAPYDINLIIESDSFYCQIAHNWLTMSYPKYVYYIYEEPYIYADPKFRLIKEPNGGEIKKIFYSY